MARDLTSGMATGILEARVFPIFLVEADFASGPARFWSGLGELIWDGKTWVGTGTLGQIGTLPETAGLQAQGVTLSLSAIPSYLMGQVLTEVRHGKPATIWFGLVDDTGAVVIDPYQAFSGRIDAAKINDDGKNSVITLSVESRLIDFSRGRERRYTHEDQQIDFPGDKGFEYVPQVQQWVGTWGGR